MTPPLPRTFKRLALANLTAQSAEQISLAAVPIIAVLALGAGPGEIGALATAQTLPFLLLSIPVLALLGFLGAAGTVAYSVAAPALVPTLVPRESLGAANGRLELARSVAFAAGPALAGAGVAWAGAPLAFVLAAMLSLAALLLLFGLPEPAASVLAPRRHPLVELREGAAMVWRNPLLRPIVLTAVAWNISWFVMQAAYVPYAVRSLGLSASGVGFTLASFGVGMVVGVLAALAFFCFGVGPIIWTIS